MGAVVSRDSMSWAKSRGGSFWATSVSMFCTVAKCSAFSWGQMR